MGRRWASAGLPAAVGLATYDGSNRLTAWDSNQLVATDPGGLTAQFKYDGLGRRLETDIDTNPRTRFVYDGMNPVLETSALRIYNLLEDHFTVLVVNARHLKQVPGRKADVRDCEWIAHLLHCGLLRGSYVPSRTYRELRDLTRHRTKLVQQHTQTVNRLHAVLQDANIKLSSVATRGGQPMEGANGQSVRLELQADCFAGVWGNRSQAQLNWLQAGDIDAALNAAAQVGDDTLQKQTRGYAVPDAFTHGTSAQRSRWFKTGFTTGDINACDTFSAATL